MLLSILIVFCVYSVSKMASWITSVMSIGKTALERMAAPADPNQVRLVNKTELASMPTIDE